ncbi:MAG: response regulator transcription factor [Phycisphaerales bacterium]|nr:response regulator transcription factor [Phycisphaerales bacterium]
MTTSTTVDLPAARVAPGSPAATRLIRRVILVDDHRLLRETLAAALEMDKSVEVVATAGDGCEGLRQIAAHRPDVAVLDIDMPGRSCFDIAQSLPSVSPQTRVVLLSGRISDAQIQAALRVGVLGILTKDAGPEDVAKAVRSACEGQHFFSAEVSQRLAPAESRGTLFGPTPTLLDALSMREREVLVQLARGLSIKQVAAVLNLSRKTVDNHTQRLMAKLDIHTRSELVVFAFREKLVS